MLRRRHWPVHAAGGTLVALPLLPAAAAPGIALELGLGAIAARSLGRLAIDAGMVVIAGLIVFPTSTSLATAVGVLRADRTTTTK